MRYKASKRLSPDCADTLVEALDSARDDAAAFRRR
jgi:hypothetical protein